MFLGSVSHSLTHRCHKPLVIVPPVGTSEDGPTVVGFNGTAESVPGLRWAAEFARRHGTDLQAVTVGRAGGPAERDHASRLLAAAFTQMDTAGINVTAEVVEGHPAEALLERAAGARLLVVGTRGRGRMREALTGSVAHACAEHSPVPVAVIREHTPAES
jgi:nucleotide-binding universal stress UspA family protein